MKTYLPPGTIIEVGKVRKAVLQGKVGANGYASKMKPPVLVPGHPFWVPIFDPQPHQVDPFRRQRSGWIRGTTGGTSSWKHTTAGFRSAPGRIPARQTANGGGTVSEAQAVAPKTGTQNGTLGSGNMDQNLRNPSCLILSHTHVAWMFGL